MSKGVRWIIAAAGLFCFFPAYDLLIRPGVPVLVLGMLPMWIIALGAGAMGLLFLTAAILGPARTIVFDPAAGEMRDLGAAGFGLRWGRRYRFRDLGRPTVLPITESEGPTTYRIMIPCAGKKRPIGIETYDDEANAREAAARLAALIAPPGG